MTITRSSKFFVQSVAVFLSLLCVGHVVSGRAFAAQSSPAKQVADETTFPGRTMATSKGDPRGDVGPKRP